MNETSKKNLKINKSNSTPLQFHTSDKTNKTRTQLLEINEMNETATHLLDIDTEKLSRIMSNRQNKSILKTISSIQQNE